MAVQKLSVSLPDVAARARRAAERAGVPLSTRLAEAAEAAAELADARAAAREYAVRFGEPDPERFAEIRGRLADVGVAVVLAPVWRAGSGQAPLAMLRRMCRPVPFDEDVAEAVGRLLALSGTADVVAAVVLAAIGHGCAVLTSDRGDLAKLAGAAGVDVPLIVV